MASESDITNASNAMDSLLEISKILNTGLDAETLTVIVQLCELGINPEAIATVIKEIRLETANLLNEHQNNKSQK